MVQGEISITSSAFHERMIEASINPTSPRDVQLSPIQTSFTRGQSQKLQRPRPIEAPITGNSPIKPFSRNGSPLSNPRKSKGGLLGLFGRSKSAPMTKIYQRPEISHISEDATRQLQPGGNFEQSAEKRNSYYSLPSQTYVLPPRSNSTTVTLPRRTSKLGLIPRLERKDSSTNSLASWDPPELFKAYPQAIKHSRLRAPFLQAEPTLQNHKEKMRASLDQSRMQDEIGLDMDGATREGYKRKREKDKKSKSVSNEKLCDKWTEKIYVLATSGYLLQYAGAGDFDRLPEKVMRLGKESAAFASDAIDGECYVLQVSRTSNEDGAVNIETSRSIFKRIGFRNGPKFTSSLLLVFDSPDDMNAWLVAVRKEIEALGGRKYQPDVLVHRTFKSNSEQLREGSGRRFLIKRDPHRFDGQGLDESSRTKDSRGWHTLSTVEGSLPTLRRPSAATQNSGDSPSLSNGTTSTDQAYLERLRETPRLSYISTGAKTLSTSRASSPDPSPARAAFSPEDLVPKEIESPTLAVMASQAQASSSGILYQSCIQTIPADKERQEPELPSEDSLYKLPTQQNPFSSPKLSIPSFSKRYSCATNISLLTQPSTSTTPTRPARGFSSPVKFDLSKSIKHRKLSLEEWPSSTKSDSKVLTAKAAEISSSENAKSTADYLSTSIPPTLRYQSRQPIAHCLSSPSHSLENLPRHSMSAQLPSPHPPPTTALPALPQAQMYDYRRSSEGILKHRNVQRPTSLQVHSDFIVRTKYRPLKNESYSPCEEDERSLSSPPAIIPKPRRAPPPPPIPIPKSNIQHRNSLPQVKHQVLSGTLPDFSLLPDISFLLDSENSARDSFMETWDPFDTDKSHPVEDIRIK